MPAILEVFQASMVGISSWGTVGDIATGLPVLLLPPLPDPDPATAVAALRVSRIATMRSMNRSNTRMQQE